MKSNKSITTIVVALIVVGVLAFQFINHSGPFNNGNDSVQSGDLKDKDKVHITRVVDGDTFVATRNGQQIKVRLTGVDTPETVKPNTPVQPFGKEASNYSKKTLTNKDVYLEYDKEKEDRYGRTLAYVWLDKDHMYNKELVEKGLAREKYFAPNGKYRNVFIKAQEKAKEQHLNIWSK
ncbi:thermonuclease family protein [Staphylococcus simiae]|uniref:thermonuclease NucI n=1 Tax=Staphylococcus simiae TaxID=308354 RepID=UPI001A95806E|nr:thermonuclease family protein [Staphylococcus simiae]MBO1199948.1 thermonuclease family protein [Staphylococcus simiae]MBO1202199.1 thermonuclease family protein [Staphylococcus simiae]MBO1204457.1 thermonuclease family protein [Staphylococcus simiae]MBO1211997.1 thermonuclease family protein [Staphylococcus simiae]MBO1230653.1 thermonuclease family protein [Staphylococcus simiae]